MGRKTTLAERLEHVMEVMDWSQADLARAAGCTPQAVNNWLSGRNKKMESEYAYQLEDNHHWNGRWLLEGDGDERIAPLSPKERHLLDKYRELQDNDRAAIDIILDRF